MRTENPESKVDFQAVITSTAATLDAIAKRHYPETDLTQVLAQVKTPIERRRFSRLIGVMVKAPFSDERPTPPSVSTGAVFALVWNKDSKRRQQPPGTWESDFMSMLVAEERGQALDAIQNDALIQFESEASLGRAIFKAFRKRICGETNVKAEVRDAIARAKESGVTMIDPTAAGISVGLASTVALAISHSLPPALVPVAAPVIGAIALLLVQVGVDGFCVWSEEVIKEAPAHGPDTDT